MDPATHKRYLDYRDRFGYFGRNKQQLSMQEFAAAETELRDLTAKDASRDDEEEARYAELLTLLLLD